MRITTTMALALITACGRHETESAAVESPVVVSPAVESSAADKDIAASLEAFAHRKIYAQLDPQALRSIDDADVEQAIVDYVFSKLEGHFDGEVAIVGTLSPGLRATYLTWVVEAEVNNGGFNQYYYNTDGRFAAAAVDAFEYFDATQHATLMREANDVRAAEAAEMAKYKEQGTLEAFSESYEHSKLGPLDDRFYQLEENLSQLRIARIRESPEDFSGQ